ncbi:ABC transporter ATP-binding protein [Proteinivorax hydrogeniformans]|uniref:ABC transporter ATP-binding protein n=1 Tax=Proteinivorax hydrogeniformans TaxID=1826727 RepID=A0AAU8HW71_9FIRM
MLTNKGIAEESVLSFRNVSFGYEDKGEKVLVLKDFNMEFYPGTFYAILGPSGAGKTTILSLGGGLEDPDRGEVVYRGTDIKKIGTQSYRKNNMAMVFQNFNLIHYMTAIENIYTAMGIMGLPKNEKLALDLLKEVGLNESQANRRVLKLSGGQQQRVAIARALVGEKDLVLADEPTGNLDNKIAQEVLEVFKTLAKDKGKCVIVVTHDDKVAKEADIAYLLENGRLQRKK